MVIDLSLNIWYWFCFKSGSFFFLCTGYWFPVLAPKKFTLCTNGKVWVSDSNKGLKISNAFKTLLFILHHDRQESIPTLTAEKEARKRRQ